jgi:hypothetical protein
MKYKDSLNVHTLNVKDHMVQKVVLKHMLEINTLNILFKTVLKNRSFVQEDLLLTDNILKLIQAIVGMIMDI